MTTPADPAAIDLEELQARRKPFDGQLSVADTDRLIAAVEALRKRVAELEDKLVVERAMVAMHKAAEDRAVHFSEAAEARVVELAGGLEVVWHLIEGAEFDDINDDDDLVAGTIQAPQASPIRTLLAGASAQALERANLGKALITASDAVIDTGRRLRSDPGSHERALANLCNVMGQISALDELGKEGT